MLHIPAGMARLLLPPMELWRWTLIDVLQGLFAVFAVTFFCVLWLLRRPRRRRVTPARVGRGVADRRGGRSGIEARRLGQRVLSAQSDGARALPEAAGQTREHARRRRMEIMETLPETTSKNATKTYDSTKHQVLLTIHGQPVTAQVKRRTRTGEESKREASTSRGGCLPEVQSSQVMAKPGLELAVLATDDIA